MPSRGIVLAVSDRPGGDASIRFLDADGKIVKTIAAADLH